MIEKFRVASHPKLYLAWPDVRRSSTGRLVSVYSECTHHGDRGYTRIMRTTSKDRGRNWSEQLPLSEPIDHDPDGWFWNCPRVSTLRDGRLVAVCDKIRGHKRSHTEAS